MEGKWGLTVLSFFSSGISVIWILKWGIAVSFTLRYAVFLLIPFGERYSVKEDHGIAVLFIALSCGNATSLRSRRLDDPSRVSLARARSLSRPLLPCACSAG